MALILNIETATTACSIALSRDGRAIAVREVNEGYSHAEKIMGLIEAVLQEGGAEMADLDAVAVSKGPGSYTGLRIGVSVAKGLAYALDKPLLATSTLEVMAHQVRQENPVENALYCPMIDARRMEVYTALFDDSGKQLQDISAEIIDENSFSQELEQSQVVFFGDGAEKCRETIASPQARFIEGVFPSARCMGHFAELQFQQSEFVDVAYFEPFYLKDFIAGTPKKLI